MVTNQHPPVNQNHTEQRYQAMLQALKHAQFRLTPQRMAICRFLSETHTHPSPGEIYRAIQEQFPTVSRATIYNTVAVLKELGEIIELPSAAGASVRYETDLTPHVNLTCKRCGRIYDVPAAEVTELMHTIDARTHCDVQNLHVEGYGLCATCQEELKQEEASSHG